MVCPRQMLGNASWTCSHPVRRLEVHKWYINVTQEPWPRLLSPRRLACAPHLRTIADQTSRPHARQGPQTPQTKGFEADRQPTGQRPKSAVRVMSTAPIGVGQKGPRAQCAVRGRGLLARKDEHNAHYFASKDPWVSAPQDVVNSRVCSITTHPMLMVGDREPCASKHPGARFISPRKTEKTGRSQGPVLTRPSTPVLKARHILLRKVLSALPPQTETCKAKTWDLSLA